MSPMAPFRFLHQSLTFAFSSSSYFTYPTHNAELTNVVNDIDLVLLKDTILS